jgi:uncharacterized RDD family membrane protein YckC
MTPESPYAPPQASLERDRVPAQEELATLGQRLGDYVIDVALLLIVNTPVSTALFLAGVGMLERLATILSVDIAYYLVLETSLRATVGKLVTGVRVVSEDGKRASFGQILGRTLSRFIPFEPFSFLFDARAVGWHDSLSRTRVIRVR